MHTTKISNITVNKIMWKLKILINSYRKLAGNEYDCVSYMALKMLTNWRYEWYTQRCHWYIYINISSPNMKCIKTGLTWETNYMSNILYILLKAFFKHSRCFLWDNSPPHEIRRHSEPLLKHPSRLKFLLYYYTREQLHSIKNDFMIGLKYILQNSILCSIIKDSQQNPATTMVTKNNPFLHERS